MAELVKGVLGLAGTGINLVALRRSKGELRRDFLPTDAEASAMARPLAAIALRHTPEELGEATDLVDGLEFVAAAGSYAMRAGTGHPGGMVEAAARVNQSTNQGGVGAPTPPAT